MEVKIDWEKEEICEKKWKELECDCNWNEDDSYLCTKCAIKQAVEDTGLFSEVCFECTQPLGYCNCNK